MLTDREERAFESVDAEPGYVDSESRATWTIDQVDVQVDPTGSVPQVSVDMWGHGLSPRQARRLAAALLHAADYAESGVTA